MVEVDPSQRRIITLRPGEMSLHHVRLVHGSPPNPSNDRRIGFAIRYIPTSVAQVAGEDSATLVRGEDRYGHFALEPDPAAISTRSSWISTAALQNATPRFSIAARRSPATTSRRHWRSEVNPVDPAFIPENFLFGEADLANDAKSAWDPSPRGAKAVGLIDQAETGICRCTER